MSVRLTKNETVSLVKAGAPPLTRVRMGLGWDAVKRRGLFGGMKDQSIDLDASCVILDSAGAVLDQVWFQQLQSMDGVVRHTGDNLTGAGDGDDESILVNLTDAHPHVQTLVFVVNSFTGQDFSQIENAFCRLVDEASGAELARFDLSGSGPHSAQIMSKVTRAPGGWSMTAIGVPASGRTFQELLPAIVAHA